MSVLPPPSVAHQARRGRLSAPWRRAVVLTNLLFVAALPWLIVSSHKFNVRNTYYRNVRFGFSGTYLGAFKAYIGWTLAAIVSLGLLVLLARREIGRAHV